MSKRTRKVLAGVTMIATSLCMLALLVPQARVFPAHVANMLVLLVRTAAVLGITSGFCLLVQARRVSKDDCEEVAEENPDGG